MSRFTDVIERLAATIETRRGGDASTSYTAQLLGDLDRAAKKMGEEAVETVIAAAQGDRDALTAESADLLYHWLVLIAAAGVDLDDVAEILEGREGTRGLAVKAARPNSRGSSRFPRSGSPGPINSGSQEDPQRRHAPSPDAGAYGSRSSAARKPG